MVVLRALGVTVTGSGIKVHNLQPRVLAWPQIAAVVPEKWFGSQRVVLVTTSGERIGLRAPVAWWGFGEDTYWRDYHRIGQAGLAHHPEWRRLQ